MSKTHKVNTGYELAAGLLDKSRGRLETLLMAARARETAWLEFKADPFCRNARNGEHQDDYSWHILAAVIGFANACGGAILIGVDDTGKSVPLLDKESGEPTDNLDKYSRDLQAVLFSKEHFSIRNPNTNNPNRIKIEVDKSQWRSLTELKTGFLDGREVLVLLVKEAESESAPVIYKETCKDNSSEVILVRKTNNEVGAGNQPLSMTEWISYMKNRPEIPLPNEAYCDTSTPVPARPIKNAGQFFFDEWRNMIQQLDGMQNLLQSNEHDALRDFCGIIEKSICDMDMFCNGQRRNLSLGGSEIHQVWLQLIQSGQLAAKLQIPFELHFPDLSEIEVLKELDRQHSPKLKRRLNQLFYNWANFADDLADCFPAASGGTIQIAQNNLPRIFEEIEFVGRKEQLDEILQFLSHRENRNYFLTITGEGGMGKSTLALAAAYAVLNHDPKTSGVAKEDLIYQNIIWASAKERDFRDQRECPMTPDIENYAGLLDTILSVLDPGHSMADMNAKQNKIRQILQSTRSLLIIDNMETINDDSLFDYLKNKIPAPTKIIGTDRNRAKTDRAIQLPPMDRDESKSLIQSLAGPKGKYFSEDDFTRFYQLSYGIPKVIEWGCRLLNRHEAGIEDVFRHLTEARKGTKNQIYEYLFGFSYEQLSPTAKKILNVLALFDFPVQCKLIGLLTGTEKGVDEYIDELSSYTLLLVTGNGGERSLFEKYAGVQDYIRIYAAVKADSSSDFNKFEFYSKAKKVFLQEILRVCGNTGWPHVSAYSWVRKNLPMIKWLFDQLIEAENISDIHSFIMAVVPVLSNIGIPDEIDAFCRRSLSKILNMNDSYEMEFDDYIDLMLRSFQQADGGLKNLAADIMQHWTWNMFRQARNNFTEASQILDVLLASASEISNPRVNILVLRTLGLIDKEQNLLDSAEEKLLRVTEQCIQYREFHIEAITYGSLGSLYRDKNDLVRARDYMEKAFKTLEKIEDQNSIKEILSVFYQKYAKLMIKLGKVDEAELFIQKAMAIDEQIGRLYGFAHNKQLMATIHERAKNYSQAYHLIREAREIFVRLNSRKEIEADYDRIKKKYESQPFT